MEEDLGKPLTRFLIALGHSPDLLERFRRNPDEVIAEWNLQELAPVLRPGATLEQIQDAVNAEHAGETADAIAIFWILVGEAPTPRAWIRAARSMDEEDAEETSGEGGGPQSAQ